MPFLTKTKLGVHPSLILAARNDGTLVLDAGLHNTRVAPQTRPTVNRAPACLCIRSLETQLRATVGFAPLA